MWEKYSIEIFACISILGIFLFASIYFKNDEDNNAIFSIINATATFFAGLAFAFFAYVQVEETIEYRKTQDQLEYERNTSNFAYKKAIEYIEKSLEVLKNDSNVNDENKKDNWNMASSHMKNVVENSKQITVPIIKTAWDIHKESYLPKFNSIFQNFDAYHSKNNKKEYSFENDYLEMAKFFWQTKIDGNSIEIIYKSLYGTNEPKNQHMGLQQYYKAHKAYLELPNNTDYSYYKGNEKELIKLLAEDLKNMEE